VTARGDIGEAHSKEPAFRFYQLYDKVYREDILEHAYRLAKQNGGAPGVDGKRFEDIEAMGLEEWLAALGEEVRKMSSPVNVTLWARVTRLLFRRVLSMEGEVRDRVVYIIGVPEAMLPDEFLKQRTPEEL
jgi:hypothetical protein